MSGAEFLAVIGGISAILTITNVIADIYKTVKDKRDLPEAFSVVASHLPIVTAILESAKQHIDDARDEALCKKIKHIVERCEANSKTLRGIFEEVKPSDGAWKLKRYYKAVKAKGKGSKVESLMANILKDIQLLAMEHGLKAATADQQEEILAAITELSEVPSSVPDSEFHEAGVTMNQSGSGTQQYTAKGNAYSTGGGKMFNAETQNFVNNILGSDKDRCMQALFLSDPRDDREKIVQIKGSRVDGTCEWIKSHSLYVSWFRSSSQLLWLSGGPGKGKTMLSVFLAEELERTANNTEDTLFLQYFCDNKDEWRNTAVTIMRGLLYQLLLFRPTLFEHILPSFKIQNQSLFTHSSFETLWRIFITMLRDPVLSGDVYCVIDGLDECDETSLEVLLGKLKTLFSEETSPSHRLKFLVVSRDIPRFIPELLANFPRVRLDTDADSEVNDDLQKFIDDKVEHLPAYSRCPEELRMHVKRVFGERAQGTFLWVSLVAKALRKCGATEIEKALDEFPSGLDELYARMLLQIEVGRRELAAKILLWVVKAVRPLTLSELGTAVGLDTGSSNRFSIAEVARDQVVYCGSFLTIDRETDTDEVRLVHQSAKDYLLRKTPDSNHELKVFRIQEEDGNYQVANKCLQYMQNGAFSNGPVDLSNDPAHLKAFPLLSYATLHWPGHANASAQSRDIFDLSLHFYQKKSPVRRSWLKTYQKFTGAKYRAKSFTLLHLASYFGILPLAKLLVGKKGYVNSKSRLRTVNKKDSMGKTPLIWAAKQGHEAIVYLLAKRANINAKDNDGQTAITQAASFGNEAIIELLLEKGADIKASDNNGYTALIWAAISENKTIMQLLLKKGADIEAKDNKGYTALLQASLFGNKAMLQLLLEKGADIEAKDNNGYTALIWAAISENKTIMQLLLKKGADIEAKDNNGYTALIWAAAFGNKTMIQLLLEKGANIEAKDNDGYTALIRAAISKNKTMIQLLLEKGADIEAKDNDGETALTVATTHRHSSIMRLLNSFPNT